MLSFTTVTRFVKLVISVVIAFRTRHAKFPPFILVDGLPSPPIQLVKGIEDMSAETVCTASGKRIQDAVSKSLRLSAN
eukprot:5018983-Ditylum_brightwellii.AAC.1